jgi:hypothetical protein
MKIHSVGAKLFHADGCTDGHTWPWQCQQLLFAILQTHIRIEHEHQLQHYSNQMQYNTHLWIALTVKCVYMGRAPQGLRCKSTVPPSFYHLKKSVNIWVPSASHTASLVTVTGTSIILTSSAIDVHAEMLQSVLTRSATIVPDAVTHCTTSSKALSALYTDW